MIILEGNASLNTVAASSVLIWSNVALHRGTEGNITLDCGTDRVTFYLT